MKKGFKKISDPEKVVYGDVAIIKGFSFFWKVKLVSNYYSSVDEIPKLSIKLGTDDNCEIRLIYNTVTQELTVPIATVQLTYPTDITFYRGYYEER